MKKVMIVFLTVIAVSLTLYFTKATEITHILGATTFLLLVPALLLILFVTSIKKSLQHHPKLTIKPFLLVISCITMLSVVIYPVFKWKRWPGDEVLFNISIVCTVMLIVTGIFYFIMHRKELNQQLSLEFLIILIPALFVMGRIAVYKEPDLNKGPASTMYERNTTYASKQLERTTSFISTRNDSLKAKIAPAAYANAGEVIYIDTLLKLIEAYRMDVIQATGGIGEKGGYFGAMNKGYHKYYLRKHRELPMRLEHYNTKCMEFYDKYMLERFKKLGRNKYMIDLVLNLAYLESQLVMRKNELLREMVSDG